MAQVRSVSPHDHSFPALDGLRGLAVALVLIVHTAFEMDRQLAGRPGINGTLGIFDPIVSMGGTGVHLFFVLSGFLLFLPFARHLLGLGAKPSTRRFYKRRALRILPAYYAVMVLTVLLFEWERFTAAPVTQGLSHLLLVHNYSEVTFKGLNGPTWTMAVESQFYVMLPLLAGLAWYCSQRSPRLLAVGLGLLLLASPASAAFGTVLRRGDIDTTFLSVVSYLSVFGAGMAGALVLACHQAGRLQQSSWVARAGGLIFALIFGGFMLANTFGISSDALNYYGFSLLMGACYLGLLLLVLLRGGAVAKVLALPAPRFLGDISYSVYLWHYPLTEHVSIPLAKRAPDYAVLPAAVLGTFALVVAIGFVSFVCVERPFLEKKRSELMEPAAM